MTPKIIDNYLEENLFSKFYKLCKKVVDSGEKFPTAIYHIDYPKNKKELRLHNFCTGEVYRWNENSYDADFKHYDVKKVTNHNGSYKSKYFKKVKINKNTLINDSLDNEAFSLLDKYYQNYLRPTALKISLFIYSPQQGIYYHEHSKDDKVTCVYLYPKKSVATLFKEYSTPEWKLNRASIFSGNTLHGVSYDSEEFRATLSIRIRKVNA